MQLNHMRFIASITLAGAWVLGGCGQKTAPKIDTGSADIQQAAGGVGLGADCTGKKCAPATMDVSVQGKTDSGLLVGVRNEAVPWSFSGVAKETGRDVAILLNKIPPGAQINPPQDGKQANLSVSVNWTPTAAATSSDKIQIYARDLTRCKALEDDPKRCAANKVLKDYDVMVGEASWEIVNPEAIQGGGTTTGGATANADGVTVKVSDPKCGGIQATTDQQIQGSLLQTGLKIMTGGGLMSILPGLLSGAMNQSSNPTPTPC